LDGASSLDEAVGLIQRNTRHYAKRQLTWWRRDSSIRWREL
jgi:tRNA dimethylallyltransferase